MLLFQFYTQFSIYLFFFFFSPGFETCCIILDPFCSFLIFRFCWKGFCVNFNVFLCVVCIHFKIMITSHVTRNFTCLDSWQTALNSYKNLRFCLISSEDFNTVFSLSLIIEPMNVFFFVLLLIVMMVFLSIHLKSSWIGQWNIILYR